MAYEIALPQNNKVSAETLKALHRPLRPDAKQWNLLPVPDLRSAIVAIDDCLTPIDVSYAGELAARLVGSYPSGKPTDANQYLSSIETIFAEYPSIIAEKAVDKLTREIRFLPSRADVHAVCLEYKNDLLAIKNIALAMLTEHQRRTAEAERRKIVAEDRKKFKAKHGDKSMLDVLREEGVSMPNLKSNRKE